MLIHNVFFWLRADLPAAERERFTAELERLTRLPYLERGYAGPPAPTPSRPVTDQTFDFALALHFKTLADHDHYQQGCPEHARFVATCKAMWTRVVIYDVSPR